MKITVFVFCTLLLTFKVFSQQENTESVTSKDSVYKYQGINPQLTIPEQVFEIDWQFSFLKQQSNLLIEGNNSNLWLRTEMALSYPEGFNSDDLIKTENFSAPLYTKYMKNQKFNPLFYVLGMAQTAAVGYMAYRHIKKYGFFK